MSANQRILSVIRPSRLFTGFLIAIGLASGYYLAAPETVPQAVTATGTQPIRSEQPSPSTHLNTVATIAGRADPPAAIHAATAKAHRFPMTANDIKDTQGAPDIAVDNFGNLHLVWASIISETEQTALLASCAKGANGFSEPKAVVTSPIALRSQGNGKKGYPIRMAPHVVARRNAIYLAWTEKLPGDATLRMVVVKSIDSGDSFSEPLCVHTHPQARPTFTALAIGAQGELACSWLDGRAMNQHPYASLRGAGASEFLPEFKLPGGQDEKGVCPCCPMGATFGPDGTLFVAFRNLVDGYRDLAIVRRRPGEVDFDGPFPVTPPSWKFDGCPHDGPSLVVANGELHATWMDAHTGVPRAYYGRASLEDLKFDVADLHASGPGTQGNAKLYADARGRIHAVWEESLDNQPAVPAEGGHAHGSPMLGSGRAIRYACAPNGARTFELSRLIRPAEKTYQTRPAITGDLNDQIYVAWCELNSEGKSVVVTSVADGESLRLTQGAAQ